MKTIQLLTIALIVLFTLLSDSTHAQSQHSTIKCLENIDYWYSETDYLEEVIKCFTQKSRSSSMRTHNSYDYFQKRSWDKDRVDVIERFIQKYRQSRPNSETDKATSDKLMNAELNRLEGETVPNRKLVYLYT